MRVRLPPEAAQWPSGCSRLDAASRSLRGCHRGSLAPPVGSTSAEATSLSQSGGHLRCGRKRPRSVAIVLLPWGLQHLNRRSTKPWVSILLPFTVDMAITVKWTAVTHALPYGSLSSRLPLFWSWNALKTTLPRSRRKRVAEDGPGHVGRWSLATIVSL